MMVAQSARGFYYSLLPSLNPSSGILFLLLYSKEKGLEAVQIIDALRQKYQKSVVAEMYTLCFHLEAKTKRDSTGCHTSIFGE
jgi:hypothetical protein